MNWIEWAGGECPVPDAIVEVRLRCRELNSGPAGGFDWSHGIGRFAYEGDDDIVAYQIKEGHESHLAQPVTGAVD